jgi:response regulator RpfG family c-di-GMP phosphodiesterase
MTHLKPMTSSENTPFHILVVDPDPIVLSALTQQLESEGFQVSTTEKPEEALSALPSHDFAVVVAAQEMVGMTGIDFFSRVKQVSPGSTRLLVSSQMPLVTLLEAVKSGAIDRFLVKPWLRGELLSMVKNCAALRVAAANAGEAAAEAPDAAEAGGGENASSAASGGSVQVGADCGDSMVGVFIGMLGSFHPNLGNASSRTMALCETISRDLNLSAEQARSFKWAGGLHAIGLIQIERAVVRRWLRSEEKCTEQELARVRQHPRDSVQMLEAWPLFSEAAEIIHSYGEHWAGTGFPDRLRAEAIPVLSRYLSAAVYYGSRHQNPQLLLGEMEKQVEVLFDRQAVEAVAKAAPRTVMPRGIREILLIELDVGMVLAHDINNSNGLCILAKDREISPSWLNKISSINSATPLHPYTMIYC